MALLLRAVSPILPNVNSFLCEIRSLLRSTWRETAAQVSSRLRVYVVAYDNGRSIQSMTE